LYFNVSITSRELQTSRLGLELLRLVPIPAWKTRLKNEKRPILCRAGQLAYLFILTCSFTKHNRSIFYALCATKSNISQTFSNISSFSELSILMPFSCSIILNPPRRSNAFRTCRLTLLQLRDKSLQKRCHVILFYIKTIAITPGCHWPPKLTISTLWRQNSKYISCS